MVLAALTLGAGTSGAAHAAATVAPFGTNDAGGFRNVLPPGTAGTADVADFGTFTAFGTRPAHSMDQLGLYTGLQYASPTLTDAQVPDFFKDATFGVRDGQVESTSSPRPGVTILRDKAYGVPHVYGETRADTMFGAGYVGAQDRLFLMDVLRHTGRAELSSFVGGSPGNREMDRTQWALAPYTEADLHQQVVNAPRLYGADGAALIADATAYVDGINAYIAAAKQGGAKLPAEYTLLGRTLEPWKLEDVLATASLVGGIFGKGGGSEVKSAVLERALEKRFGKQGGRRAWADLRSKNDPEAPTTIAKRFPYETQDAFSARGLAMPDAGSVKAAPVAPPLSAAQARAGAASLGGKLLRSFRAHPHASNWELIAARHSATGHPIGVLGPQVGYYIPQILMEEDLHGPGIDAQGAAFAGANLYVLLGHGRDYAWSATTATSDNVDTFAEVLCQDDTHYLWKGQCRAMDKLERRNRWTPNLSDMTAAGSETLTAYRTVHGIVTARGTVGGKKVAFASARTTYGHEADSAIGFSRLNDPGFVKDAQSFRRAVDGISFVFNWGYIDGQDIAYQLSGHFPIRAKGVSPDFPVLGTGAYDWQGFDPELRTSKIVGLGQRPHAVNPDSLVSWNNKQAPGWAAADDKFTYGPVFRSQMIEARVRASYAGGRKATIAQLVQAMEEPASQDFSALSTLPALKKAIGSPSDPKLKAALKLLSDWAAGGAHRRDLDRNGADEDTPAITLMDAWWPRLTKVVLSDAIGPDADRALKALVAPSSTPPGGPPKAPDYDDGWYSFVNKDLRSMFTPKTVKGRWSRGFCGGGVRATCRRALRASLKDALTVTAPELYGRGDCASRPDPACFDQNRSTITGAIGQPPFPFQNRPTFQQVVTLDRRVPR
ncbi:MAG: Penicillin amidase [Solirubrobacterales bacterium]|nr:Penicillin amidase [Solirubrobacterales bacterium]